MSSHMNLRLSDESMTAVLNYIKDFMAEEGRTITKTEAINRMLTGYGEQQ